MIRKNEIIEENVLKENLIALFAKIPSNSNEPKWLSNFLSSTTIVLISIFFAFFLSKIVIWLLKSFYLNKNRGYFKEEDTHV